MLLHQLLQMKLGSIELQASQVALNVAIADTIIYCINDGNTSYTYNYNVVGTSNIGQQTAVTIAFDTTEILLNY